LPAALMKWSSPTKALLLKSGSSKTIL